MSVLIIVHDLKTPLKDYEPFYKKLKEISNGWAHYFENAWVVNTHLTAQQFAQALFPYMTKSDHLLVTKISREYNGWLPKEAWEWLDQREF